jgi:pyruvate/2-oxoglutarate dehydrogenase complex dihydrolipoamide acyltransferase (E2) component
MLEAPCKITIPQETVNDESVRIVSWNAASGSFVEKDQLICEVETSKTVVEIHAPIAGILTYGFPVGEEVEIGKTICEITPQRNTSERQAENARVSSTPATAPGAPRQADNLPAARATPLARKIAAEYRIDISTFPGGTLVRKNDILRRAGVAVEELAHPGWFEAEKPQVREMPVSSVAAPVRGVPIEWSDLPRRKLIEGKVLGGGKAACVQSSVTASVRGPAIRMRVKKLALSTVGFDALILFEVARLLRKFPALNAVYDRGRIGEYQQVNIGWALDGGQGLVVPVVKSCDQKGVQEIAAIMERQLEGYLENSLPPEDLAGGTFTLSNLSGHGVHFFDPLISQGQSAILGVGSDPNSPGGELFYLTLAFDHQLAEGRVAATFVGELSRRLEAHGLVEDFGSAASEVPVPPAYCVLCHRDTTALHRYKAILLKSEVPPGLVCSLCISGF